MKKIVLLVIVLIVGSAHAMESFELPAFKKAKIDEETKQRVPLSLKVQAGIKINQCCLLNQIKKHEVDKYLPQEMSILLCALPYKIDFKRGLYTALKHNNYELVQEWLAYRDNAIDVNDMIIGRHYERPLHIAALSGDEKLLKIFTDMASLCVTTTNMHGQQPLCYAVLNGNMRAVKYLCSYQNSNPVKCWLTGESWMAYDLANNLGFVDIKNILLSKGFQRTSITIEKNRLFFMALEAGAACTVKKMITQENNTYQLNGQPALHRACQFGHADIVSLLLENGALVNELQKASNFSALHWAAAGDHVEVIRVLLDNKAEINQQSRDGSTPLHIAAESGKMDAFQALCNSGAKTNIKNNKNFTPYDIVQKNITT